jgi:predicted MFS family arabinose efflux permease
VKEQVGAADASMGAVLLALGAGSIAALFFMGSLIGRHGSDRVLRVAAFAACAFLPLASAARTLPTLTAAVALLGSALGAMDVSMNAQGAMLEKTTGRSCLSFFHALWSLGALIGAAVGGAFADHGCSPRLHFAAVAATCALSLGAARRGLLEGPATSSPSPTLARPSPAVIRIGLVAMCAALVEGGVADWSGIYLRDSLGTSEGLATRAFAAFSLAMLAGRSVGDRLVDRFGGAAVVRSGSLLAGAALAVALSVPEPHAAVIAFLFVGVGVCAIFPMAFREAGRLRGPSPGQAIAAVATMGYGAGLLGPPTIGLVASATSLRSALWLLVLASALGAVLAGRMEGRREDAGRARSAASPQSPEAQG